MNDERGGCLTHEPKRLPCVSELHHHVTESIRWGPRSIRDDRDGRQSLGDKKEAASYHLTILPPVHEQSSSERTNPLALPRKSSTPTPRMSSQLHESAVPTNDTEIIGNKIKEPTKQHESAKSNIKSNRPEYYNRHIHNIKAHFNTRRERLSLQPEKDPNNALTRPPNTLLNPTPFPSPPLPPPLPQSQPPPW